MNKICVLGLGYIGLPTSSVLATQGFEVVGVDTNDHVLNAVSRGNSHLEEPGLRTLVEAAVKSGHLRVQREPETSDVFMVCVPTPLKQNSQADLGFVEAAVHSTVPYLKRGDLVILESTVPPGTTTGKVMRILERSGLTAGVDFHLAYCPERVLPGRILTEIVQNSRIIGGINEESARRARELYERFVEGHIFLSEAKVAEMVKLTENTYRDLNIALANELARICSHLGIDVWEVIELANQHPRVHVHRPGPGVGGHCIGVDPWFIVQEFPNEARLIRTGREINEAQPRFVSELIHALTYGIDHPRVAILGVAYKGDVGDTRGSPALALMRLLDEQGYEITAFDPHVNTCEWNLSSLEDACKNADCLAILASHSDFRHLNPRTLRSLVRHPILLDTCHIVDPEQWTTEGFRVSVLGQGAKETDDQCQ